MGPKLRRWVEWIALSVIVCWALALAVDARRERARENYVGRSILILASPLLKLSHHASTAAERVFSRQFRGEQVEAENERLERRIGFLELELAQARDTVSRLERLTGGVEARNLTDGYRLVLADIVGRGRESQSGGFLISRGSNDGLAPGMPVAHGEALVGMVVEAHSDSAYVQLLTDPAAFVACVLEQTREAGVARGLGQTTRRLEFLPDLQGAPFPPNGSIVTSGLTGSLFPGGLRIGTIERTESSAFGERVGIVSPAVDFASLEEVVVLVPKRPPAPASVLASKGTATTASLPLAAVQATTSPSIVPPLGDAATGP
jgi:rod shape-determining protein MreC